MKRGRSVSEIAPFMSSDRVSIGSKRPRVDAASSFVEFGCTATDHAETPAAAYSDIEPLLTDYAAILGKRKKDLQIYDPYYCAGAVKRHLREKGFSSVYNEPEDFYKTIKEHKVPVHDVIVTNPPFSGDHIARLFDFLHVNGKPFLVLLPQYEHKRSAFMEVVKLGHSPFFIAPKHTAYSFTAPSDLPTDVTSHRTEGSSVVPGHFQCVWFADFGADNAAILARWKARAGADDDVSCVLAERVGDLPQLAPAKKLTPAERRWRKKMKMLNSDGKPTTFDASKMEEGRKVASALPEGRKKP